MKPTGTSVGRAAFGLPAATFDTRVVAAHERIDYWEQQCAEKVVGLRCSCLSESGLEARYHYFDFGRIKMIDIAGGEHFIERTPFLLRQREKDSAFLTMIVEGKIFVNRAGDCTVAEAGDVVLYDTNQAYIHGFPSAARQVIFEISGEDFRARFGTWSLRQTLHFAGASNPAGIVPMALQSIFRVAQSASWETPNLGAAIEGQVWEVMETAHSLVNGRAHSTYHARMLQRVRSHIAENLGNPELCPSSISHAMGISLRQLNRLFEAEPLSLMEHVQAKRLEAARLDLLRRGRLGDSVSDICYKWGFKSLAHFSRKFRERFGTSPSQFR